MTKANYTDAEKYVKLFINKYISASNSSELVGHFMSSIEPLRNREDLYKIIERNVTQNPNSEICCAVFGHRVLELSRAKKFDQFLELARWVQKKFPETKLSVCAKAVLADNHYEQDNYIAAMLAFKPKFFTHDRPESEIIKDIDSTLTLYEANTFRTQGIDSGKVYEVLAEHSFNLDRNVVAVHCYKKSSAIKGFDLQTFEDAASETTSYSNSEPDTEVWFWKGLFAAEEDDLMTAAMTYKRFLKTDTKSILAARAYYDTARARMVLGQYSEARDAIDEAKRICPCEPINQLEQDLNNSTNNLRRSGI
jgi:tetratricopeptide (TPR) repeat protein